LKVDFKALFDCRNCRCLWRKQWQRRIHDWRDVLTAVAQSLRCKLNGWKSKMKVAASVRSKVTRTFLESLLRASSQSVLQECLPGLSCTSVFQVCLSGVSSRNVFQVCLTGLSCWRVLLACLLQSVTEILGVQTLLAVWRWLPCAWPQWLGQVSFCKWSRVLLSFQITFCNTWIINNHLKISERLIAIQI
jgi:hypothetical protein